MPPPEERRMRFGPLAVTLTLLGVAFVAMPVAAPPGDWRVELRTDCEPGDVDVTCHFEFIPSEPVLIFYRFDAQADGRWDFPQQIGGGDLGTWSTLSEIWLSYASDPFRAACVQAWDGTTVWRWEDRVFPVGPVGCVGLLEVMPHAWSQKSNGRWVSAEFVVPTAYDPRGVGEGWFLPDTATLAGIPVVPWPGGTVRDDTDGAWRFRLDRGALTGTLGPGEHVVPFRIRTMDGASLTVTDTVRVL